MKQFSSSIDIIKKSIQIFSDKKNLEYFLKIGLISLLLNVFYLIPNYLEMFGSPVTTESLDPILQNPLLLTLGICLVVAVWVLNIWSQTSIYESVRKVLENEKLDFKETFKSAWVKLLRFFSVNVLVGLVIVLGFLLLIIPGLIFSIFYSFALFEVMSGNSIMNSMKTSKALVKGRFWSVTKRLVVFSLFAFLVGVVTAFVPYNLGNLILALFGSLFILPSYLLYKELKSA